MKTTSHIFYLIALMLFLGQGLMAQSERPSCKKCWQDLLAKFEPLNLDKQYDYYQLPQGQELVPTDAKDILRIFEKNPQNIRALGRLDFEGKQKMMILFFTFEAESSLGRKGYLQFRTINSRGEVYANGDLIEVFLKGTYAQTEEQKQNAPQGFKVVKEGGNYRVSYQYADGKKSSMLMTPSGRQQF